MGRQNTLVVSSGSNALHLAVKILDLPVGSDVVVPSFTWVSCAHAVVLFLQPFLYRIQTSSSTSGDTMPQEVCDPS